MLTMERELQAQCEAFAAVFAAAHVPYLALPDVPPTQGAFVALRPALRALRVRLSAQRWIEQHLREDPDQYQVLSLWAAEPVGVHVLWVPLKPFLLHWGQRGRHPVCTTFAWWYTGVISALMRHGYYDPATNDTPPAAQQLDALERREEGRDVMNRLMPGFGDVMSGHRPGPGADRQMFGYLRTDEDGNHYFIRECDLTDDAEEDDDER